MLGRRMMMAAAGAGGGVAEVAFVDEDHKHNNLTTYTFSSMAFGVADAARTLIAVVAGYSGGTTVSSVTFPGAIGAAQIVAGENADQTSAIWVADVPSGTSGDVVVVFSAMQHQAGVGLFRAIGITNSADDTGTSTASPLTDTLTVTAGGIVVAGGKGRTSFAPVTWSANMTEGYDVQMGGESEDATGASGEFATGGSKVITCTQTGGADPIGVFASFPAG